MSIACLYSEPRVSADQISMVIVMLPMEPPYERMSLLPSDQTIPRMPLSMEQRLVVSEQPTTPQPSVMVTEVVVVVVVH